MIRLREVVEFLINREESSARLFSMMTERTHDAGLKEWFQEFYRDTLRRKNSLMQFQKTDGEWLAKHVPFSAVKQYMVDIQMKEHVNDGQALALSILRAETTAQLYSLMRSFVESRDAQALFGHFQEELEAHRVRCNALYERVREEG